MANFDTNDWIVAAQNALSEFFPERGLVQLTMDMVGDPLWMHIYVRADVEELVLDPPDVKGWSNPEDWLDWLAFACFIERYDLTRKEKQVILQTARDLVLHSRRSEIGRDDLILAIAIYKDCRAASLEADTNPFQRARKIPIPKVEKPSSNPEIPYPYPIPAFPSERAEQKVPIQERYWSPGFRSERAVEKVQIEKPYWSPGFPSWANPIERPYFRPGFPPSANPIERPYFRPGFPSPNAVATPLPEQTNKRKRPSEPEPE
jgi:hypothetical protein